MNKFRLKFLDTNHNTIFQTVIESKNLDRAIQTGKEWMTFVKHDKVTDFQVFDEPEKPVKPCLDLYFLLVGIERGVPIKIKFTFTELVFNQGPHKDTELFYTLQERSDIFEELENFHPIQVPLSRDHSDSIGLLMMCGKEHFDSYTN